MPTKDWGYYQSSRNSFHMCPVRYFGIFAQELLYSSRRRAAAGGTGGGLPGAPRQSPENHLLQCCRQLQQSTAASSGIWASSWESLASALQRAKFISSAFAVSLIFLELLKARSNLSYLCFTSPFMLLDHFVFVIPVVMCVFLTVPDWYNIWHLKNILGKEPPKDESWVFVLVI